MASPCTDWFISNRDRLELELRGLAPGVVGGITEIIDEMMGKFKFSFFEETLPADSLGPVTQALVLVGASGVGFDDPLDGVCGFSPTRRLIGDKGHDDLGEFGHADTVGNLATHHDDDTVTFLVGQGERGAHGVAVTAEHAAVLIDGNGFQFFVANGDLGRFDGGRGAGGNGQGNFAHFVQIFVIDDRRFAVIAEDGDIGAVHGAAHVQAAGQGDTQLGRQAMIFEVIKQHVHGGLNRSGGIRGRGVAVDPTLGVDDVGNAGTGAAHGELEAAAVKLAAFQVLDQGLDFVLAVDHELDIVAGGEAQVAVAMLVGDFTDLADVGHGHQAGTTDAHGVAFVAAFGHMHQHAGFDDFVIQPFALVLGNNRRVEQIVFLRTDVGDPVFHRFVGIVS
ncbi:Dissimilatory sulfite reductase (modular protein) [Desulfosarcina cetonica]|nr:Dissimilatory sulfite reductase (modular protein) [Desulfosarcina cetonica]